MGQEEGGLYELTAPNFRQIAALKALNIAVKNGYVTYSETFSLFDSWRRDNDVAKWDGKALKLALRETQRRRKLRRPLNASQAEGTKPSKTEARQRETCPQAAEMTEEMPEFRGQGRRQPRRWP